MDILLATQNPSKVARVRELLFGKGVTILTPKDAGLEVIDVEEGSDIAKNAEAKARAYLGKTDLPILGLDSAFVIPGEDLDPAKVRRNTLAGRDEKSMNEQEIVEAMIAFYQGIVKRRGGPVPAYWDDATALVLPDGTVKHERDRRPVELTDSVHGEVDPHFPLRSIYIIGATGKYAVDQTEEDERKELRPFQEALERILF